MLSTKYLLDSGAKSPKIQTVFPMVYVVLGTYSCPECDVFRIFPVNLTDLNPKPDEMLEDERFVGCHENGSRMEKNY
jgi:hypothetical protein